MGCARKPRAGGVREDFLAQHSMECLTLVSSEQDHFIGFGELFFLSFTTECQDYIFTYE